MLQANIEWIFRAAVTVCEPNTVELILLSKAARFQQNIQPTTSQKPHKNPETDPKNVDIV